MSLRYRYLMIRRQGAESLLSAHLESSVRLRAVVRAKQVLEAVHDAVAILAVGDDVALIDRQLGEQVARGMFGSHDMDFGVHLATCLHGRNVVGPPPRRSEFGRPC